MIGTRVAAPAPEALLSPVPVARPDAPRQRLWLAWLEAALAHMAERRQLLALEERELRDIGLTRAEAVALAREPFWRR